MKKIINAVVLFFVCLCMTAVPALAEEQGEKGSLQIVFEKEGSDVKIDGASVSVYKVADLEFVQDQAVYTLLSEYNQFLKTDDTGHDVTFDGMTADDSSKLAKDMVTALKNPVAKGVTGQDGSFSVDNLDYGMYLVGQTNKSGTAAKYKAFDPFLISVPLYNEETKEWTNKVVTHPKTTVEELPGEDTPTPTSSDGIIPGREGSSGSSGSSGGVSRQAGGYQTGDLFIIPLFGAAIVAIVVLVIALIWNHRKGLKNNEE